MDGIIVVNKEKGMTSHDVVNRIRKIFKTKRVGHLGTLDPLATGVLVICLNDATKLVQFLQDHNKTYIAKVCLGKATDTYDLEGKVTEKVKIDNIDEKLLDEVINNFLNETTQLPPLYSSIKVNGKKLYEYAREGKYVAIAPREIKIHEIKRLSKLEYSDGLCYFDLFAKVSKGTYIRSLCYDLGQKMLIPSLMADLKRINSDIFNIDNAFTLDQIENGEYKIYSMLEALESFPKIDDDYIYTKANSGMKISLNDIKKCLNSNPQQIVIAKEDKLVAIYEISDDKNYYKAARVWN